MRVSVCFFVVSVFFVPKRSRTGGSVKTTEQTYGEKTNKKPAISLERKGKDAKAKVRDVNITMVKSSLHFRIKLRHLMLI